MVDSETGYKWWLRYIVIPLIGGGGIVAVIVALMLRPPPEPPVPADIPQPPITEEKVVDFSAGNAAPAPRYSVAAAPYLKEAGISISAMKPPGSSIIIVNNQGLYNGQAVYPTKSQNFLTQADTGNVPASFTLRFSSPMESVSFTRPKLYASTKSGVTHPAWRAHALDANNHEVSSSSEGLLRSFDAKEPATYTLRAPGFSGIVAIRFDSDPRLNGKPFAAFGTLLIEQLSMTPQRN